MTLTIEPCCLDQTSVTFTFTIVELTITYGQYFEQELPDIVYSENANQGCGFNEFPAVADSDGNVIYDDQITLAENPSRVIFEITDVQYMGTQNLYFKLEIFDT